MNRKNKSLILLVGPSGSGKTTVANILARKYGYKELVSHTTREIREGEMSQYVASKPSYYFVSREDFTRMEDVNAFVETAEFAGNKYGLSKDEVENGGNKMAIVVEPQGAQALIEWAKDKDIEITSVFLDVSPQDQLARLYCRDKEKRKILARLKKDKIRKEAQRINFDLVINTSVSGAYPGLIAKFISELV